MQRLRQITRMWGQALPAWGMGLGSFLLCWSVFLAYYHLKFGLNEPPAASGDEVSYDSLGWELAHNRGYQVDTGNPAFRKPYEEAATTADRFHLGPPVQGIVTYRPPLFPLALSGLNRLFGRQFWAIRVMNAGLMAGTLWILTVILFRRFGGSAVPIALLLFIALDVETRLYGRAILTEAMSLFLTSLIVLQFLWLLEQSERPPRGIPMRCGLVGIVFGLSLLARTLMVLWIPGLCLIVFWILRRLKLSYRGTFFGLASFLVGVFVVVSPWAVRNINVTGEFMPLGTQGASQLSAAFGEEIWRSKGIWINLDQKGFFDPVLEESQSLLEREIQKAKHSQAHAVSWIKANPLKSALLFPMKIWQEVRPRAIPEGVIRLLVLAGVFATWRTDFGKLLLAILAVNFFAIGMTWSVGGRFLVPVLLAIHLFAAIGTLWIMAKVRGSRWPANPMSFESQNG